MNIFQKETQSTTSEEGGELLEWKTIPSYQVRSGHTSTLYKHFIITFGGMRSGRSDYFDHLSILNLKTHEIAKVKLNNETANYRTGHSACLFEGNQIYIFGGKYLKETLNQTAVIDIRENPEDDSLKLRWRILETKGAKDLSRAYHRAHIYKNKMFVFGGSNGSTSPCNNLWSLDLWTDIWTECSLQQDIPGRMGHASVLYKNKIFIFGGKTESHRNISSEDFLSIDLERMKWSFIKQTIDKPPTRIFASLEENNGKIYLFGGNSPEGNYSNTFFSFDIDKNKWQKMATENSITPRSYHTLTSYKNLLIVVGGQYPGFYKLEPSVQKNCSYNYIYLHDSKGELWTAGPSNGLLRSLFEDRSMTDIKFIVEEQEIPAHKIIFASSSNFFKRMFASGMRESQTNIIEVPDVKAETFKALIEFIYKNEVMLNEDLACDLLLLCDKYSFKELQICCEQFLLQRIRENNCIKFANLAYLLQLDSFEDEVMKFISTRWRTISKKYDLSNLPPRPTDEPLTIQESPTLEPSPTP